MARSKDIPNPRLGPGPISATAVRQLELASARRVRDLWPGDRMSAQIGAGTELARIRPYQPGDDVRYLDAAASARTGEPQVRVHVAERSLTTWLLLDRSASMGFGTADRVKADVAEGVAGVMATLATRRGNQLGVITFGDAGAPKAHRPHSGRAGTLQALSQARADVAPDETENPSTLTDALRMVSQMTRGAALVIVVSDFRGDDHDTWVPELRRVLHRHTGLAVEIRDPREQDLPDVGADLALVDPETGRHIRVDTRSKRVRRRFAEVAAAEREQLRISLVGTGSEHAVLSTEGDWLGPLAAALRGARHRAGWRPARRTGAKA
ncbi:MAG: DUF58 domain-containing protein [Solirubrobacteraceae bacterium]|nr:DUF58 domain-containing protein [Solirubrobacteraceae bacterium]